MAEPIYYLAGATEEAGHEQVTTAHTEQPSGHEAEGGTFTPKPSLWIWTAIAFLIVVFVLKKFAIPGITEALDNRNEQIEGDIKNAELTREEAEQMLAEYKAQLNEARVEAKKIIDEGKALGENLRQETISKAQEEANQLIKRAQEEIGREKDKAIKELQSQIADISIEVASKVIQKTLSKEEHGKLIDDYVTEVGKFYEG